jgi:predicted RNA binding protein YcfA (HicA-like mRNA interferase family)
MKPKELIKILEANGFIFARQSGSQAIYKNQARKS